MTESIVQSEQGHEPDVRVQTVGEVLGKSALCIPDYQRPYKWSEKHCKQLLNDLFSHFEQAQNTQNLRYRLGTVVLHQERADGTKLNIVDGQQRLITLTLILRALQAKEHLALLKQEVNSLSEARLKANDALIKNALEVRFDDAKADERKTFIQFVLHQCELVCVQLSSLDEAFQFFDSQNARGKALEPYDLLKAYHLRAMSGDAAYIHRVVENWEAAVYPERGNASLQTIIAESLFQLRIWYKLQTANAFKNQHIDVFKGINKTQNYPYVQAQNALQIQNTIINGKGFFDYVEHYRVLYDGLFHRETGWLNQKIMLGGRPILDFLKSYQGCGRTGDRLVYALFTYTVLQFYDRFGEYDLTRAVWQIFKWAYFVRFQQQRVEYQSIANHVGAGNSLLKAIWQADTPQDVLDFALAAPKFNFNSTGELENVYREKCGSCQNTL
ncbi:MAG: DUF262 domain-containing protein [Neisseria sp.]|nr:DUF262 domain-containing protein [Neisseria sp.]